MRLARIWTLIAALCLCLGSLSCKEDPMDRARTAHATERPDEAEKALKEVLAEKPNDFEARRLMADVHRFRGDYKKTEEALKKLWEEKGFGKDEKLEGEEAGRRDLLENQFNELYQVWSDDIDPEKEPEKFERVVREGLKWNEKSAQLNRKLVDFYLARADQLKDDKKLEAAEAYEQILELRILPAQRKDATKKAAELRKAAFEERARKHFEEVKSELVAAEQWDEEKKAIVMRIEAEVDRRLRQRREEDLAEARKQAGEAIRKAIAEMIQKITVLEPRLAAVTAVKMTSGDEELRRGKYEVSVTMTLDDVIEGAFKTHEKARLAAEEAAKDAKEGGETKPDEAGKQEGESADGGTDDGGQEGSEGEEEAAE